MKYFYGMRLRGFSPGCQPSDGFIEAIDKDDFIALKKRSGYWDILIYERKLSDDEIREYELDYICEVE